MSKSSPFINAKEFISWASHNCACCSLSGTLVIPGSSNCEIFEVIATSILSSEIDMPNSEIAFRLGEFRGANFEIYQNCPEREATK